MLNPRESIVFALWLGFTCAVRCAIAAGPASSPAPAARAQREPASGGKSNPGRGGRYENPLLSIKIARGWHVGASKDHTLNLTKGKYVLAIDPLFGHASGIIHGRFDEYIGGVRSVGVVMANVDHPAGGWECSQWPADKLKVTNDISLENLYTDGPKVGAGCSFPSSGKSVWFGSYQSGNSDYSEITITLTYDTSNVNELPVKDSRELARVFADVTRMLKTLRFKPPIVISRLSPQSGVPGATITVYGSGFDLFGPGSETLAAITDISVPLWAEADVADDGMSLTFEIPDTIDAVGCRLVRGEKFCSPIPVNGVDINSCPLRDDGKVNYCGIAIPPGPHQVAVRMGVIQSNAAPITITAPESTPVSISLIYPNLLVSQGDLITIRGKGFTPSENRVQVGDMIVDNIFSNDGETLTFRAPAQLGWAACKRFSACETSVSNAIGKSNSIKIEYH
jgi:hypothetical protein